MMNTENAVAITIIVGSVMVLVSMYRQWVKDARARALMSRVKDY